MFGRFIKHYGKNKIVDGINALNDAIVSFDPEGATEAAIAEMEENFDEINREYSKAKQDWSREQKEADDIVKLYDQRLAAAEHIQKQLESDPNNAQLNDALTQLVTVLEEMRDDVEREKEEAQDAKEVMTELEATVQMYATKLKTARSDMKKASNAMEKAKRQEERANAQADRAAQLAGLKRQAGGLSSALESMNRQATEAQARADAAKRKSELLGPSTVEENDAVAAAMAAVNGTDTTTSTSVTDRLAALKQ